MNERINEGLVDRVIRIILAVAFVFIGIAIGGGWAWLFYILAALALATGVSGTCLLYKALGINTNRKRTQ